MSTLRSTYCLLLGIGLVVSLAAPSRAELVFSWSMESETPDVYPAGSDSTPSYYPPGKIKRSTTEAHSGKYSLDLSGSAWCQASFNNPTNKTVWAPIDQGAIVLWWKYTGAFQGGMLMQLTGKCKENAALDTNDGFSLKFHGQSEIRFGDLRYKSSKPFVAGQWYKVTAKWNAKGLHTRFLQINDEPPLTSKLPLPKVICEAWHQILWGNDTRAVPQGMYLDDVQIWSDYDMIEAGAGSKPVESSIPPVVPNSEQKKGT